MVRVLVNISYQGSQFLGFQIQNNGRTVQQQFEKYLSACTSDMLEFILVAELIVVCMQ